ncbi:MAG: DUF2791 family P-loop domain-containing protein [Rhodobacteraceae bacterium]|nr:DUF2791 family P-loop domain-containing protein [Paracoccaceae bacterium]MCY4141014.1 DUF2791 family P-loop domain-containing protein [Paracoccaceae bacterium]
MTNTIRIAKWIELLDREYLSDYIRDGGSAVKIAVTAEECRHELSEQLKAVSEDRGYLFTRLDAISRRVHMPQDVFFGMALQFDWRLLARCVVLNLLDRRSFLVEGIDPAITPDVVGAVARVNGVEPRTVLLELRPALETEVTKNPRMARAFRIAMTHLCIMEKENDLSGNYAGQVLLDWITGVNSRIGNLRQYQIHTPINRTTARYFFESALYWVRFAGYSGTVILLDNSRVSVGKNPKDGKRFYTRAMTMEHFEFLRELIDDVEQLTGSLFITMADYAFVDPQSPRGWAIYPALRTRVMDDVRDRNMVNPSAALVRLERPHASGWSTV